MQIKLLVAAAVVVAMVVPLAVMASQPAVRLGELKPAPSLATAQVLSMLMLDRAGSAGE